MDGYAGVLVWVGSSLRGDGVELSAHWEAGIDVAVLKYDGAVSEYEIDGSVDVAFSVELS